MHALDMASLREQLDSARFLRYHILVYSSRGKMGAREGLIWSYSGEPCDGGEGDKRHFKVVSDALKVLAKEISECEKALAAEGERA